MYYVIADEVASRPEQPWWAFAAFAAIGVMWQVLQNHHKHLSKKLDNCEEKHEAQHVEMRELAVRVGTVEGRLEGHRQAREDATAALKGLSDAVLEIIHERRDVHDSSRVSGTTVTAADLSDRNTGGSGSVAME